MSVFHGKKIAGEEFIDLQLCEEKQIKIFISVDKDNHTNVVINLDVLLPKYS